MSGYKGKGQITALPLTTSTPSLNRWPRFRNIIASLCLAVCIFELIHSLAYDISLSYAGKGNCPQADVLIPIANGELWNNVMAYVKNDTLKARVIKWLGGAVRIPTESYDDFAPVREDPRWEKFSKFHDYLLAAFPQTHGALELEKVNTYGLMYVWKGQNPNLKPILLMAHQDVVPVEPSTWDSWKHPPFSGHFDGERIWGRGSSDDKSGLIAIMSTIELLVENKFLPSRTVVLAFGFDEEISGSQGARMLAAALEDRLGKDSFALIIDEGSGTTEQYGSVFAIPGIAERGYYDVRVEVATSGGHSSVPPPHTSIGILASLLVHYENHPFKTHLRREDPLYGTLLCYAEHAPSLPARLRWLIELSKYSNQALLLLEKLVYKNKLWKSQASTTQAADIIRGGIKNNALPENAYAVVNHRISVHSSVAKTQAYDAMRAKRIASRYNLTLNAFESNLNRVESPSSGTLTLSDANDPGLEPAPVAPTDAAPYQLLSGTIKATYNSHRGLEGPDNIQVAPGMMTGNTDTRYYWALSKHIFRYNHRDMGNVTNSVANGVHTVNEFILVDTFLEMIRFFTTLILNADENALL